MTLTLKHDFDTNTKNFTSIKPSTQSKNIELKKSKRTFSLYEYSGSRAPKSGGSYSGTPLQAALKAANRWVIPKSSFDKVYEFNLVETTKGLDEPCVYPFKVKRTKLQTPKKYMRGDKEITVVSKIISV